MPSRAIIRSGGGWSGFGPNPEEEQRARSGVETSYRLDEEQRYREREARLAEHERQVDALAHERFMSKLAENDALAKRQAAFEAEAREAVPQLLSIDPRDPQAEDKYGKWMLEHGHLAIKENRVGNVAGQTEAMAKMIEASRKQQDDIKAKADAAQLRADAKNEARALRDAEAQDLKAKGFIPKTAKDSAGVEYVNPAFQKSEDERAQAAVDKKAKMEDAAKAQWDNAYLNSKPEYGKLDGTGAFVATKPGEGAQTHVAVSIQEPGGKITEHLMPRDQFDGLITEAKQRNEARAAQKAPSLLNPNTGAPAAVPPTADADSTDNPNLTTPALAATGDDEVQSLASARTFPSTGGNTGIPVAPQGVAMGAPSVPPTSVVGDSPVPPAAVTPDPRMELAKKALNDPVATDAHRAAARKILGLPDPTAANAQQ